MRGNPIVEIIAILVMLASVLVGGAYWGAYKYANKQEHKVQKKEENVLQSEKKEVRIDPSVKAAPLTFEQAVKRTE